MKNLFYLSLLSVAVTTVSAYCDINCAISQCMDKNIGNDENCITNQCDCDFKGDDKAHYEAYFELCATKVLEYCDTEFGQKQQDMEALICFFEGIDSCAYAENVPALWTKAEKLQQLYGCGDSMKPRECQNLFLAFIAKGVSKQRNILSTIDPAYRTAIKAALNPYYKKMAMGQMPSYKILVELDLIFGDTQIEIDFDEKVFAEFLQDFAEFQQMYEREKRAVQQQFLRDMQTAHQVAQAKAYLEFGETFAPLYEAYAEAMNSYKVNENCDRQCAVENCFWGGDVYFDCLQTCQCLPDFDKMYDSEQKVREEYRALEQKLQQDLQEVLGQFYPTIVRHEEMKQKVTEEYFDLVKTHAGPMGGCDQGCVDYCCDPMLYNLNTVGRCLDQCYCEGGVLEIQIGHYSPSLMTVKKAYKMQS